MTDRWAQALQKAGWTAELARSANQRYLQAAKPMLDMAQAQARKGNWQQAEMFIKSAVRAIEPEHHRQVRQALAEPRNGWDKDEAWKITLACMTAIDRQDPKNTDQSVVERSKEQFEGINAAWAKKDLEAVRQACVNYRQCVLSLFKADRQLTL